MSFPPGNLPLPSADAPPLGAILAGGRSSRFGRDKAEASLAGKRLIDHAADALAPQVRDIIVAGGPPRSGFVCVMDRPGPDLGPLGGLNAALHEAARRGCDWVLTAPCDAARLPADLGARLRAALGEAAPLLADPPRAAYARADGRDHPTFGLWSARLAPVLDDWLFATAAPRDRAIRRWALAIDAVAATFPNGAFANVNTPEDLEALSPRARD